MPLTDLAERNRLVLQLERALLSQANVRMLLAATDASIVKYRRELRTIKARITRASAGQGRSS